MNLGEETFKVVIQNILNRWTGLRLCVEHQSGGRQSKEKALNLVECVLQFFNGNKLGCEDLEDLLEDYLDNEFQTLMEDDSIREVSATLLQLYEIHKASGFTVVLEELNKLPPCETWLDQQVLRTGPAGGDGSDSSDSESDTEAEPMDCEWTQVSYRKKR